MEKVTVSSYEFAELSKKNGFQVNVNSLESAREKYERFINDFHDVMDEMMKPEHDDIFPADIVSL